MTTTPTPWNTPTQVNATDAGSQVQPDILATADDGYIVFWTDNSLAYNPSGGAILAQRYDVLGNRVGSEVFISGATTGSYDTPAVARLPNGQIVVAFHELAAADNDVYVLRFDASVNYLASDYGAVGLSEQSDQPAITAFADGSYVVTYRQSVGAGEKDIVGVYVSPAGIAGTEYDVFDDTLDSGAPEMAALTSGNYVAVFQNRFDSNPDTDIGFRILAPGGTEVEVDANILSVFETNAQFRPDVVALSGGGFVVTWTDYGADAGGTTYAVRAAVYSNIGGTVKAPFLVNTSQAGDQDESSVTALPDGGFLVSWGDFGSNSMRAQRYDAGGNPVGSEFILKQGATSSESEAAAAVLRDGRIAFAMVQTGPDIDVVTTIFDPRTSPLFGTDGSEAFTSRRDGASVSGLGGDDVLFGLEGADVLDGGANNDVLQGGGAADRLIGGLGRDQLLGGEGGDRFAFLIALDSPRRAGDTILDFSHRQGDKIDLSAIDAVKGPGNQKFHLVDVEIRGKGSNKVFDYSESFKEYHHDHAKAKWAGLLRITKQGLVQGDINGDGKADFELFVVGDKLVKGDFIL